MKHRPLFQVIAIAATGAASLVLAADIVLTPPMGGGVSVTNAAGSTTRLRVADDGTFTIPGLATVSVPATGLCVEIATGKVGTCSIGTITSLVAGTGLSGGTITTTGTVSIAASYQLPQSCSNGQMPAWNGSAWTCAANIVLAASTASAGNIMKGGNSFIHNYGTGNTFIGEYAGNFTTFGTYNTASGMSALSSNMMGNYNTATGYRVLQNNISGDSNTASGLGALSSNTYGTANTAYGYIALIGNTIGNNNIALGNGAGGLLTTGSFNISIGNGGVAAESNTTRIGTLNHTRAFIAGIRGVTTGNVDAVTVVIDSQGQLGTVSSSRRFKDDIADMDAASSALMKLRPVTFHYRTDQNPSGRTLQYGLVAEEVAEVYPGLVAHSADGRIETVMYQFLPPMLLNEYQKQQRTIEAQAARIDALESDLAAIMQKLGLR